MAIRAGGVVFGLENPFVGMGGGLGQQEIRMWGVGGW